MSQSSKLHCLSGKLPLFHKNNPLKFVLLLNLLFMKKLTLTLLSLLVVGAIYFTSCKKTNEGLVEKNNDITNQDVTSPVPKWLEYIIEKLLPPKKDIKPGLEIKFGHNVVIDGKLFECIEDQICSIKSGEAWSGTGSTQCTGEYIDNALYLVFDKTLIQSSDLVNFSGPNIVLSNPVSRLDFNENADALGLPLDFSLQPGNYPIIYENPEYYIVKFEN